MAYRPPRGRDAKPRSAKEPGKRTRSQRGGLLAKRANVLTETAKVTGQIIIADRSATGRRTGVVFGTSGLKGGMSVDPGVSFAYWVRSKMRPIRVAPTEVRDGTGRLIARILVDPVTGARRREPVDAV